MQHSDIKNKVIAKAQTDPAFRRQLIDQPKATLEQELGFTLPEQVQVKVIEEIPDTIYLFLPRQVAEAETSVELSEETLDEVAGGQGFQGFQGGGLQDGGFQAGFQGFQGGGFQAGFQDVQGGGFQAGFQGFQGGGTGTSG